MKTFRFPWMENRALWPQTNPWSCLFILFFFSFFLEKMSFKIILRRSGFSVIKFFSGLWLQVIKIPKKKRDKHKNPHEWSYVRRTAWRNKWEGGKTKKANQILIVTVWWGSIYQDDSFYFCGSTYYVIHERFYVIISAILYLVELIVWLPI